MPALLTAQLKWEPANTKCPLTLRPAAGWDPTAVLCNLRRGSLLEPDVRDDLTSAYDMEELMRAARQELRRARRGDKMAK